MGLLLHAKKVMVGGGGRWWWWILVSAQGPLVFGFLGLGLRGLGPGLDNSKRPDVLVAVSNLI